MVAINAIFIGALEVLIDDMAYKKAYYFHNNMDIRLAIKNYSYYTVLSPNDIKKIIALGKEKYIAKLDPNYRFMGYVPQYISHNFEVLIISFPKIKTMKLTTLEWAIIISSAYVYEIYTNSLSLDYDNLDLN